MFLISYVHTVMDVMGLSVRSRVSVMSLELFFCNFSVYNDIITLTTRMQFSDLGVFHFCTYLKRWHWRPPILAVVLLLCSNVLIVEKFNEKCIL